MDMEITKKPLDYIKIVFRRKWFIIIPLVIGLSGGIVAANVMPKVYESSTLILVEEGRVINPLIQGLAVSTSVAQRLSLLREQILGWDRINQLIKNLNLAKDISTQQQFEDLVKNLRKDVKVKLHGPNIIGISYHGEDPIVSMNIVKTITDIFIAENLRQQNLETENAVGFINDQLDLYKKKLKQGEIAEMDEKLSDLLIDSTGKHPLVIEYRKKIEAAKTELEEGNFEIDAGALGESDTEVVALKEELKVLRDDIVKSGYGSDENSGNRVRFATTTNDRLYKLLLLDKIDKVAKRDTGVNQTLYNELLKRLETAKITQRLEASRDGTRYTILDPARKPLKPVKPNKILTLFLGAFMGIFTGLCLVFGAEAFDHSFLSADDAKAYLEKPILGAISKIITQADVRAQKLRNIKVASLSILTTVVLLVVIVYNIILGG
ncbi:MAG: GNVR domain-containing protein [Candidatus Omnitrophota bacterium]